MFSIPRKRASLLRAGIRMIRVPIDSLAGAVTEQIMSEGTNEEEEPSLHKATCTTRAPVDIRSP
jgi:hypothetical protein